MNGNSAIKHAVHDKQISWAEVMNLAGGYGFIRFAYGGVAMLCIEDKRRGKK